MSYIEAWHAIAEANRIFGFDGWSRETVYCKEISRVECKIGQYKKDGFKVGYEAKVRITVGDVIREGTGHGCGTMSDLFDCVESAAKEAESDAMKRALMTFGNQFGLALYDKSHSNVDDHATPKKEPTKEDGLKNATDFVITLENKIKQCKTKDEIMTVQQKNNSGIGKLMSGYPELFNRLNGCTKEILDRVSA